VLASSSSAFGAKGMEIAVQDDAAIFGGLYSTPQIGLGLAERLHATRVRVNVGWSYVVGRAAGKKKQPKHVKYNWSGYDLLIANAAAYGIKVQLVLTGMAPAYATSNHRIGPMAPSARKFKAFVTAAAKHFKKRGVDRYSIWNEPNHRGWIAPIKKGPKIYRALYVAGYSAIKRVDRKAKVMMGETSPFGLKRGRNATPPLKFLRGVTCAKANYKRARKCSRLKTDGYAHHPYDFEHKPTYRYPGKDNVTIGVLPRLTRALAKLKKAKLLSTPGGGVPFVYLTEYGYLRSGKRKMAESKRGKYLVQGFSIAQRNPRVKEMLQYLMVQPTRRLAFFDTSLATRAGKPFPAFLKLEAWTRRVASAGAIATTSRPGSGNTSPGDGGGGGGGSNPPPSGGGGSDEPPPPPPDTHQPPPQCTLGPTGIPICP
jgi:Cellulase (glycosyl hydrolase family 5)